jgi:hypothetical protein
MKMNVELGVKLNQITCCHSERSASIAQQATSAVEEPLDWKDARDIFLV